ncbi:glycosyltransferase family 2 protein [Winogradskyella sp. SYSU M77433]|uniref:glycosyltransferase family 2 protein n=1 Tax=Winogradskyella sp. SYSU M77433 TaxID=3042722 RepID=UPI0024811602|nr:glycosyltransferase family 2 protein [Winogradskyella sp. SYSU M77433]MDH7911523.1 glycosyltransferase family 2 protein [Winogradskyella sp. SYSU M77433]
MKKNALFSIITINYNDASGLQKSMQSVICQTFKDYEYIVIDGGSNDGSTTIIENHKAKIHHSISEPDKGVYDAMNKGLLQASGEYVFFLNSGDLFYDKNTLKNVAKAIEVKPTDIIYGDVIYVNPNTKEERITDFQVEKISLYQKMICHQAIFCKKKVFDTLGGFNLSYKIKADYDWFLRTIFKGVSIKKINLLVAYYEEGGLSETHFSKYSAGEIPKIRNTYYSDKEQKAIRKYILNPKLSKLPFHNASRRLIAKLLLILYPNLRMI